MTHKEAGAQKRVNEHLGRYFEVLGLRPGASLDEINTKYFTIVKQFPENPTEEDEARVQELKNAYNMLRRAYVPVRKKEFKLALDRRVLIPALSAGSLVALAVLVALNWGAIKMKMTHYDNGAILRFKTQSAPYGQVVGFESTHRFPTGNPSAAYNIKLNGTETTVWVSERLVVNGMTPAAN